MTSKILVVCFISFFFISCKMNNHESPSELLVDNQQLRDDWILKHYMADQELCPEMKDPNCETAYFVINLPNPGTSHIGHTGFAIKHKFFDFGPEEDMKNGFIVAGLATASGSKWWSNPNFPAWKNYPLNGPVELGDIIANIEKISKDNTTLLIPMSVTIEHSREIEKRWEELNRNPPRYSIPGMHCTSATARIFEGSDTNRPWRVDAQERLMPISPKEGKPPLTYALTLLENQHNEAYFNYTHRCGPLKGRSLRAIVLHTGDSSRITPHRNLQRCPDFQIKRQGKAGFANTEPKREEKFGGLKVWYGTARSLNEAKKINRENLLYAGTFITRFQDDEQRNEIPQLIKHGLFVHNAKEKTSFNFVNWNWYSSTAEKDSNGDWRLLSLGDGVEYFGQ